MQPVPNLTFDDSSCEICQAPFEGGIAEAEMFDPNKDDQSFVCHYHCGLQMGLEPA